MKMKSKAENHGCTSSPRSQPGGVRLRLAVQPDGKILLSGNFSTVWGVERSGIARLNADGSLDPEFAPTNVPLDIRAIAFQTDGKVVLGIGYPTAPAPQRYYRVRVE